MNTNLKKFLTALIIIGCIYFLLKIAKHLYTTDVPPYTTEVPSYTTDVPKYSFTIPPAVLQLLIRPQCAYVDDPNDPWSEEDWCTIIACHEDNNDANSCSKIEPLLKVANENPTNPDQPLLGNTISEFESFLWSLQAQFQAMSAMNPNPL